MAEVLDIHLNEDGDIELASTGDFRLVNSVIQQILIKLRWIAEEWRWDESLGMPYPEYMFRKQPDISLFEDEIKEAIFNVKEITEVPSVSIRLDKDTRSAYVSFTAKTDRETYRKEIAING